MKFFVWCLLLLASATLSAQEGSVRIEFNSLNPAVIQHRLEMVRGKTSERREVLEDLFREAGCTEVTEQLVPGSKEPNVVCAHDGGEPGVIVVGGHYDAEGHGMGAVDDWSGASLLPSLYESIEKKERRHRFVFVGFSGEEAGLIGSGTYVKRLSKDARALVRAMVNLECLGLTPPKVWTHRADKGLLDSYLRVANALQIPPVGVNVENVGDDDSHAFLNAKIPVITIHSVTQETWPILHSRRDQLQAINPEHYYTAYRVVATYLTYLDSRLP
jgi:Iap family predicted aminopeptidase